MTQEEVMKWWLDFRFCLLCMLCLDGSPIKMGWALRNNLLAIWLVRPDCRWSIMGPMLFLRALLKSALQMVVLSLFSLSINQGCSILSSVVYVCLWFVGFIYLFKYFQEVKFLRMCSCVFIDAHFCIGCLMMQFAFNWESSHKVRCGYHPKQWRECDST